MTKNETPQEPKKENRGRKLKPEMVKYSMKININALSIIQNQPAGTKAQFLSDAVLFYSLYKNNIAELQALKLSNENNFK